MIFYSCLLSIRSIAQVEYDIIRPSINADQFNNAVKAETALSKGQVSLNIPLMELKGKGYNLPILLTFYNGDVTFRTEASPVGLGWSLIAGGAITQTIKGTEDNRNSTNNEHFVNGNYLQDRFSDIYTHQGFVDEIIMDPMPDEYTYSLPGHNGTIDVSLNEGMVNSKLYPDESYKIEPTDHGYCIIADDGTKFYYEDWEKRNVSTEFKSTSWFISRIETAVGGLFTFNYATEEYVDLSSSEDDLYFAKYITNRIESIVSDYGSVVFHATRRDDRGSLQNCTVTRGYESKRIDRIELRDENGDFVKGFELDNSGVFTHSFEPDNPCWIDYRHKLSSVTQYDASGNRLPSYEFNYSYKFAKSRLAEIVSFSDTNEDNYLARDSWTSNVGTQAYVDLSEIGEPSCYLNFPNTPYEHPVGLITRNENFSPTADDYLCLSSVTYPNGTIEEFTYENHKYSKVNWSDVSPTYTDKTHGKRLAAKVRRGLEVEQRTEYIYNLHDSEYNVLRKSSGVMTNPSIHGVTYYTPGNDGHGHLKYVASIKISEKTYNSFMGPPVSYTEVEEVEKDMQGNIINRNIHYFSIAKVAPPINYIFMYEHGNVWGSKFLEIENLIYGKKRGYSGYLSGFNNVDMTYMAYPLGEFNNIVLNADIPIKDVFIGENGNVRSISEYSYHMEDDFSKYGYKVDTKDFYDTTSSYTPRLAYTISWISKSEYFTKRLRRDVIKTTRYFYDGNRCDSLCERYTESYDKGRIRYTAYNRGNDMKSINYYFPGDILNVVGCTTSPSIEAVSKLIEKNIVGNPLKTVIESNGIIIGGECKEFQINSDIPLLKSIYKIKNTGGNRNVAPVIRDSMIDYQTELYKEGDILTYDEYHNPEHIRINDIQDRIYVWGYDGQFPVAIIDNMDYSEFNSSTDLKNLLRSLSCHRRIDTIDDCVNLRNTNRAIRQMLPGNAHITTYTYDPYFGMTSEIDDSNLGIIYTYDSFGRLSAKYDIYYKKQEEYNYHLHRQ